MKNPVNEIRRLLGVSGRPGLGIVRGLDAAGVVASIEADGRVYQAAMAAGLAGVGDTVVLDRQGRPIARAPGAGAAAEV